MLHNTLLSKVQAEVGQYMGLTERGTSIDRDLTTSEHVLNMTMFSVYCIVALCVTGLVGHQIDRHIIIYHGVIQDR